MSEHPVTPRRRGVETVQCKYLLVPEARDLVAAAADKGSDPKSQSQIIEDLIFDNLPAKE